jgi:hypothetical protein
MVWQGKAEPLPPPYLAISLTFPQKLMSKSINPPGPKVFLDNIIPLVAILIE